MKKCESKESQGSLEYPALLVCFLTTIFQIIQYTDTLKTFVSLIPSIQIVVKCNYKSLLKHFSLSWSQGFLIHSINSSEIVHPLSLTISSHIFMRILLSLSEAEARND